MFILDIVLDVLRLMGMHPQAVRQFAESKFLQLIISRGTTVRILLLDIIAFALRNALCDRREATKPMRL